MIEIGSQWQDQYSAIRLHIIRPPGQYFWNRHIGNLKFPYIRINLRSIRNLIYRFKPDTEKSDLLFAFCRLPDGSNAHHIASIKGGSIVPDDNAGGIKEHTPVASARVFGVLQKLDQEMSRIGIDAPGQKV